MRSSSCCKASSTVRTNVPVVRSSVIQSPYQPTTQPTSAKRLVQMATT